MKQTNSSLRQALEGGIDPLRPPEVRLLFKSGCRRGFFLVAQQKGEFSLGSRASVPLFLSLKDIFLALQANTKFNSRWTTDEQLLAVQGG